MNKDGQIKKSKKPINNGGKQNPKRSNITSPIRIREDLPRGNTGLDRKRSRIIVDSEDEEDEHHDNDNNNNNDNINDNINNNININNNEQINELNTTNELNMINNDSTLNENNRQQINNTSIITINSSENELSELSDNEEMLDKFKQFSNTDNDEERIEVGTAKRMVYASDDKFTSKQQFNTDSEEQRANFLKVFGGAKNRKSYSGCNHGGI